MKDNSMNSHDSTARFCPKCQTDTARNTQGACKPCAAARSAAHRAANPDKVKAYTAANADRARAVAVAWQVANPERRKAHQAAYRAANVEKSKAYRAANADKINARSIAWQADNPEKRKAQQATYRAANPEVRRIDRQNRRARKLFSGGTLSRGLAANLFEVQRGLCACCQDPLGDDYHLDHIMPLALGGTNTDSNMQLLLARCNLQKGSSHPDEFMQDREFDMLWNR